MGEKKNSGMGGQAVCDMHSHLVQASGYVICDVTLAGGDRGPQSVEICSCCFP